MNPELLGFFQNRMATAYQEQTWAVALAGAMNAFIASHAGLLLDGFSFWVLAAGISLLSLFALAFVWSRHCIFMHYDRCVKKELEKESSDAIRSRSDIPKHRERLARWSGVTLYALIIGGLWIIALRMLIVATNTAGHY